MLSPASPPGPALGPALREGLKPGPGPSPTFKARARPELDFLGPDPSLGTVVEDRSESGTHRFSGLYIYSHPSINAKIVEAGKPP